MTIKVWPFKRGSDTGPSEIAVTSAIQRRAAALVDGQDACFFSLLPMFENADFILTRNRERADGQRAWSRQWSISWEYQK